MTIRMTWANIQIGENIRLSIGASQNIKELFLSPDRGVIFVDWGVSPR
jgi:hypothetical protein